VNDEMRELRDRLDVSDAITRYAFALDHRDWAAFDSIYDDEVVVEMPHIESASPTMTRAELVRLIQDTVNGFEATHHMIPNHLVTVDGDTAECQAYANAWHTVPTERGVADYCLVRGYYVWGLRRTPSGWRINRMVVQFGGPVEGYLGVYEVAAARARAGAS
jgi:ketosteroid isomerase-like protein